MNSANADLNKERFYALVKSVNNSEMLFARLWLVGICVALFAVGIATKVLLPGITNSRLVAALPGFFGMLIVSYVGIVGFLKIGLQRLVRRGMCCQECHTPLNRPQRDIALDSGVCPKCGAQFYEWNHDLAQRDSGLSDSTTSTGHS
jgi:hypothetical protein